MKTPRILATTIAALVLAPALFAVTDTWDGGGADNNISTNLNWLDNTAPVSDLALTDLVFDGTVRLTPNFSAPFSANTVTFNNNAAVNAFTFGAGSALTVGGIIVNNDAQTQTFNNVVNVGNASANFVASAGGLSFANIGLGANALGFNTLAGASGITAVTGSGSITKSGAGSLSFGGAGAATQSWDLVQSAGPFFLNAAADLTVSTTGSISVNGGVYNANGNVTMNATPFTLSGTGSVFIATGKTLTLLNGASLTSSVALQHNTPGTITATGSGTVVNAGTNPLFVNANGSTLNVLAGADATFLNLIVGGAGTSTALFDGAGTTATASNNNSLIGNGATGLVTFRNGAAGTFGSLNLATSGSSNGQLNIQTGGTVAVTSLGMVDDSLATETGTITVDGAGSVFSITGAGTMASGAASLSTAAINVQNSGTFNTGTGLATLNTTGTVNITSGGTFNANGDMTLNGGDLGRDAGSVFNVASGRTLTVQNGSLASFAGNQGFFGASAVVTGAGSAITSSGGNLNFSGGGTISVNSGGHLDSTNAINFAVAGGLHTVTVDGAGSQITAPGGGNLGDLGGTANVTFSNNAVGNFGGTLRLGESIIAGSTGTVLVQSGADVTSAQTLIASTAAAGTTGAVTVTGAGSTWTVSGGSQVNIGATSGSSGTLTIGTGGIFNSGTGNVTVNATGTLAIAGGTYNSNGTLLVNGGQLTRSNPGTLNLALGTQMTVQAGGDAIFTGLIQQFTRANLAINGAGSTLTTGGDFQWEGGNSTLSLLSITNGGLLSSGGSLHLGRNNTAVALTANGAGAQIVSSPFFTSEWQAGVLLINGASATLGALRLADVDFGSTSFGSLDVQSGATASIGNISAASGTAQETATITVTGPGSAITQSNATGPSTLTLGAAFLSSATLSVNSGGAFTSGTGTVALNATGAINIGGGALTLLGPLARNGGTLTFTSGALSIVDNWNVGPGGLLGVSVTLFTGRQMATTATTTIDTLQTLTLDGGKLSTGALVNNGTLDFIRGTLAVTGAGGFNIGSGALGANVTLGTGSTLQVTNTATVASGASLLVDGGSASLGVLNNNGLVEHLRGTLTIAGAATNLTGADFFATRPLSVGGVFTNQSGARLTLQNGTGRINGAGSVINAGLITGDGVIAVPVTNSGSGDIRAEAGKTLYFTSSFAANAGDLILQGGTLDFANAITNAATGFISGRGALHTGGLTNNGVIAFSGGNADIRGDVVNAAGARIVTSGGGAVTTFFDDVVHNGLEIFTGAGASTVFYGSQSGAGSFTGTGTVYFIGDLRPGNSPASVLYEGDLVFGGASSLTLEIGGPLSGSQYDHLNIGGALHANGDLVLALLGGFTPQLGDTFDLFDVGTFAGDFDSISAPALSGGNAWDFSALKTNGSVTVVPEPGIGALLLSALGWLGLRRSRPSKKPVISTGAKVGLRAERSGELFENASRELNALNTMKNPRILATGIAALLTAATLHAQTWDGGGANDFLTTAANWNPDGVPISTADVIFGGAVRLTPNVASAFTVNSLTFNNTAGAFVFGGAATLSIRAGGIVNNDATTQEFNNAVSFAVGATSLINAASGGIVFDGAVTLPGSTLTLSGAHPISFHNAILGTSAITKSGTGSFTIFRTANVIGADFNLNAGETFLIASSEPQTFSSTSAIAVNGAAVFNVFEDLILDGGQLTRAAGATVLLGSGTKLNVQNGGDLIFTGSYFNTFADTAINVNGSGSTFSTTEGLTLSSNGALNVLAGGDVSTGDVTIGSFSKGTVTVDGLGSSFTGRVLTTGQFVSSGSLTFSNGSTGAFLGMNVDAGGELNSGTLDIQSGASVTGSSLNIAAAISSLQTGTVTISGANSTLTITGAGTTTLGTASSNTATLRVQGGGLFNSGTGAVNVNATGTIHLDGGTVNINGPVTSAGTVNFASGTLNLLGGNNLTVGSGGLLGANLTLLSNQTLVVAGSTTIDTARTLTLNGGALRTGALVNNGALAFQSGTLGITGAGGFNIGTGVLGSSVTLNAGANLEVTNTLTVAASASLNVSGGSFLGNAVSNVGSVRLNSGGFSMGGTFTNSSGGTLFVSDFFTVGGAVVNSAGARVTLRDGTGNIPATGVLSFFSNFGLLTGDGTIGKSLTNQTTGEVRAESGKTLVFTGGTGAGNAGVFSLQGGTLEFTTAITNAAAGFISGHGALRTAGLTNSGTIAISGGNADIFGDTTNGAGAKVITSGGAVTTFFDDVVHNGVEIRTSAGGGTVFFGAVSGAGPFTGTGTTFFEGDLRPGNSPALVTHEGNVVYGTFLENEMELGGTVRGTQYDAMNVAGKLTFGGTLNVPLIGGFQPAAGNVFNLYDFGTTAGTFTTVNLPAIAPGLIWNQANLYTAGEIQVALDPVFISRTWDGGGANNNWITDNNWTLDVQPLNNATADLIFTGNVRLAPSVDTPWNVRSITFNNAAGAFTITGPQSVTVGSGGIVNDDTQTQTITAAITLSANETFNAAAGDLAISSVALAGQTLALTGANDITLATASGSGTINKNNTGDLDITGALGTGGVILNANAGETKIGFSETLAALNIANGATVTLGAIAPSPPPEFGDVGEMPDASALPVPEPGSASFILLGAALLGLRRKKSCGTEQRRQRIAASSASFCARTLGW